MLNKYLSRRVIASLLMVTDKSIYGTLKDSAKRESLGISSLCKLLPEMPGYAADERERQILAAIGKDVDMDEIDEVLAHQITQLGFVKVAVDELRETGEKTVCKGLPIDTVDQFGHRKSCFTFKTKFDFF